MDSFDWLKDRIKQPKAVVDLSGVAELRGVRASGDGIEIGAMTTLTDVVNNPLVKQKYNAARAGGGAVASPQIRNQGTIGGNVSQDARCWYYRAGWPCYRAGGNICYADTPVGESRTRDPGRGPLRRREPVRHGAGPDRARREVRHPHRQGRACRRRRGLLHRTRDRHHPPAHPAPGRSAHRDPHSRPRGRERSSISRRSAIETSGTFRC